MPEIVIDQRRRDLGGLQVGRVLPYAQYRKVDAQQPAAGPTSPTSKQRSPGVGPFVFFDHLGPIDFPPGIPKSVDVRPHPHIGLATLTYLFAGEIMHRDSVASQQAIRPGEVNWMVAGQGVTHSERFEHARAAGGPIHGIQSWVALPREAEETQPSFAHFEREALPLLEENGATARLLAGAAFGLSSPVATFSPLFYLHWTLPPGAKVKLPGGVAERAAYVVSGQVETAGSALSPGQMLVYSRSEEAVLQAKTQAIVMALGGEPVGERFIEWNFVSSSKERIAQAKADWRAGRMKLPDFDDGEFIPLPPEPPPPPPPSPL